MTHITYTLSALKKLPTLSHTDTNMLKISTTTLKVWLSTANVVTIERYHMPSSIPLLGLVRAQWHIVSQYETK